jgi:hypothetical protein
MLLIMVVAAVGAAWSSDRLRWTRERGELQHEINQLKAPIINFNPGDVLPRYDNAA